MHERIHTPWLSELTLLGVARPARYAGLVLRTGARRGDTGRLSVVLAVPDLYEDALGETGLASAARSLDRADGVTWDIVAAPWMDMESRLRRTRSPLSGLLTSRPVGGFDLLVFLTRDELQVSSLLTLLDLAGIPLRSEARGDGAPIVLVSGRLAWNPEPFHAFADGFLLGDAEPCLEDIVARAGFAEVQRPARAKRIDQLASVPGIYVPALHSRGTSATPIGRRLVDDLDRVNGEGTPFVPLAEVSRERVAIEVQRGCGGSCRACATLAPAARPRRRSASSIRAEAAGAIASAGWADVALAAPPGADAAYLGDIVATLADVVGSRRAALTLPALRPRDVGNDMLDAVARLRRTRIVLAPEVSGEIADWEPLLTALEAVGRAGWKAVDLEFALGPGEAGEVARDMLPRIFRQLTAAGRRGDGSRLALSLSLQLFTARAHTAYQWEPGPGMDAMNDTLAFYRGRLQGPRVRLRWDDAGMAAVRGRLARAGRSAADIVEAAWRRGARFDHRRDVFDVSPWSAAFAGAGLSLAATEDAFDPSNELPWDHLDMGNPRAKLVKLREALRNGSLTSDCHLHGRPDPDAQRDAGSSAANAVPSRAAIGMLTSVAATSSPGAHAGVRARSRIVRRASPAGSGPVRVRILYSMEGALRFLSHLDIVRLVDRLLRQSGLPVECSQGTSPHPRVSFGPPRAVGMSSRSEFVDIAFASAFTEERQAAFRASLPPGMAIGRIMPLYGPRVSLDADINCGAYRISLVRDGEPTPLLAEGGSWDADPSSVPGWLLERAAQFEGSAEARLRRVTPKKVQEVDLRASLIDYDWDTQRPAELALQLLVAHGGQRRARPSEVAAALVGIPAEEAGLLHIERTGLYWREPSGMLRDPFGDRYEGAWAPGTPVRSAIRRPR